MGGNHNFKTGAQSYLKRPSGLCSRTASERSSPIYTRIREMRSNIVSALTPHDRHRRISCKDRVVIGTDSSAPFTSGRFAPSSNK